VVFDAFRVTLLEDATGAIDQSRFPNLAALAREATWYRNATTAHENTTFSVPAILDGVAPRIDTRPTLAWHPQNVFTLLARDHRMNVHEEATELCPPSLCGPHGSTNIIERLSHGRVQRFASALRGIHGGGEPALTFVHAFFPHEPRQYLPDGRSYQPGADLEPALDGPESFTNAWLTQQSLQRTLLQMMFTDRLIGRLVGRLRDTGQWDRTLVILTADHGESFAVKKTRAAPFKPGHLHWRRAVTDANIEEIAPVPLFVKYPGQRNGQADDRFVKTLDVLPTIADVTDHPATWRVAGHSLRDESYRGMETVSVGKTFGGAVSLSAQRWLERVRAAQRRVLALFPAGAGVSGLYGIGPRPELHGRALPEFRLLPRGRVRAALTQPERWRNVHLNSSLLPLHVTGRISGGRPNGRPLAIAVNGRIAATAWSFRPLGKKRLSLSSLIPETALRSGPNDVRVYEIAGKTSLRRLG
jgi:Sulfatase